MFFTVISTDVPSNASRNSAFLITDRWDDWGKYRTMFYLVVIDEQGIQHRIGSVKIGQVGLQPARSVEPGYRAPELPPTFDELDNRFFSLGQGEDYYVSLNELNEPLRNQIANGLNDCAFNLDLFELHSTEYVMTESLLRNVNRDSVRFRFHRLTQGDSELTPFHFNYFPPTVADNPQQVMSFEVTPLSQPPSNVHVLIGRNGVGKTRCMQQFAEALLGRASIHGGSPGHIEHVDESGLPTRSFARLLVVSFSAFDNFDLMPLPTDTMNCVQIGLPRREDVDLDNSGQPKKLSELLAVDFRKSLERCRQGLISRRWQAAVRTLEGDDLFAQANVTSLLDLAYNQNWIETTEDLFGRLSSGHAIVLLTVTKLVELVDEKTIVLMDEPEGHLHPPLLSAFIRCLSDLLFKRNGVAIIATHSPVVLQEVPKSCAWKLRRSRLVSIIERPTIETFGENIGLLTREVFGLEVTHSGYHQLLQEAVDSGLSFDETIGLFDSQVGAEARAIIQGLIAERDGQNA